ILPFRSEQFREASVTDRPGEWGPLFDRIAAEVDADGGLITLDFHGHDHEAYAMVNRKILEEALELAEAASSQSQVLAVVVWDGAPRHHWDLSLAFAEEARARNLPVAEILTTG